MLRTSDNRALAPVGVLPCDACREQLECVIVPHQGYPLALCEQCFIAYGFDVVDAREVRKDA